MLPTLPAWFSIKIRMWFFALLSPVLLSLPATAGDAEVSVHQAEIRATAGAMTATGGYARITNFGPVDVRLVGVDVDFAAKAEIHTMFAKDGVMKMRPLERGLVIPAGGHAKLKPGGDHLMFMGLTTAMEPGSVQHITFVFDDGNTIMVMAHVKKPADIGGGVHDQSVAEHDHTGASGESMKIGSGS